MNIYDIKSPDDIKNMSVDELENLCKDIRSFLIENVSKTGGHLSSNLGVVELSVALHYIFQSPNDKMIFDVGHQSYIHKILTGRASQFSTLRQFKGLSGFQKRYESTHDVWEAGHSSTSLSAALGMAVARDLNQENYQIIPIIGDGSLSSGMAMEALNQIGYEKKNMVIIFNDNNMSISKNVGAMDAAFTRMRTSKPYISLKEDLSSSLSGSKMGQTVLKNLRSFKNSVKDNVVDSSFFGEFGLDYIGPVDGHDIKQLLKIFKAAKKHNGPIVIHVITKKGKGYSFAEEDVAGKWHGVPQFDAESGIFLSKTPIGHASWSEIISESILELAKTDDEIVAITPAMAGGSKLTKFFQTFPDRSFDCGIAEEHATTFAASLANCGKKPFISIYSSFLQRAYDQINHDIARMDLPVVIGIDRAGLVGEDGETHHGVFDISLLRSLPNMILCQPKDANEAQDLVFTAFQQSHPVAIRYPRGNVPFVLKKETNLIPIGTWTKWNLHEQSKVIIIAYGIDVDKIISKATVNAQPITVINARFFKPLDETMMLEIMNSNLPVIIYETDILAGGLSSAILEYSNDHHCKKQYERIGIKDHFVEHGSLPLLRRSEHLDINFLFERISELL